MTRRQADSVVLVAALGIVLLCGLAVCVMQAIR